jgi:CheY-like chemotaxis protein
MLASQSQRAKSPAGLNPADCTLVKPIAQSDLLDAIMTALGFQAELADTLIPRNALGAVQRPLDLLLAEDNEVNQALAMRLLEKLGHAVTLARNGVEAVQWWRDGRFDAILMDVDMPVKNGYQATQEIRALEASSGARRTPIVAMTAHAMRGVREECLRHGMDGYVSKPIDTQALLQVLADLERIAVAPTDGISTPAIVTPSSAHALEGRVANLAHTRVALDNDRALFDEILALYRQDAPRQLQRITEAVTQTDMDSVKRGAHAIRGMVGVFGAERAMHAAQALEHCGDPVRLDVLLGQLRLALDELDADMTAYHWD